MGSSTQDIGGVRSTYDELSLEVSINLQELLKVQEIASLPDILKPIWNSAQYQYRALSNKVRAAAATLQDGEQVCLHLDEIGQDAQEFLFKKLKDEFPSTGEGALLLTLHETDAATPTTSYHATYIPGYKLNVQKPICTNRSNIPIAHAVPVTVPVAVIPPEDTRFLSDFNSRSKSFGSWWRNKQAKTIEEVANHAINGNKCCFFGWYEKKYTGRGTVSYLQKQGLQITSGTDPLALAASIRSTFQEAKHAFLNKVP